MVFKNEKVVRLNHQTEIKKLCFVATYLVFLLLTNCRLFDLPKIGRGAEILAIVGTLTNTSASSSTTNTGTNTGTGSGTNITSLTITGFTPTSGIYGTTVTINGTGFNTEIVFFSVRV